MKVPINNTKRNPAVWVSVAIAAMGAVAGVSLAQKARIEQDYVNVTGSRLCYPGGKLFTGTNQAKSAARDKVVTADELQRGGMMFVSTDAAQRAMAYYEREFGLRFTLRNQHLRADRWTAQAKLADFDGVVSVTGFKDEGTTLIGFATPKERKAGSP